MSVARPVCSDSSRPRPLQSVGLRGTPGCIQISLTWSCLPQIGEVSSRTGDQRCQPPPSETSPLVGSRPLCPFEAKHPVCPSFRGRPLFAQLEMLLVTLNQQPVPSCLAGSYACRSSACMAMSYSCGVMIIIMTFTWSRPRGAAGYTDSHACAWSSTNRSSRILNSLKTGMICRSIVITWVRSGGASKQCRQDMIVSALCGDMRYIGLSSSSFPSGESSPSSHSSDFVAYSSYNLASQRFSSFLISFANLSMRHVSVWFGLPSTSSGHKTCVPSNIFDAFVYRTMHDEFVTA
jgi:hypothetical protein